MAAENFKVKKGLEVGTAITATGSGIDVTAVSYTHLRAHET